MLVQIGSSAINPAHVCLIRRNLDPIAGQTEIWMANERIVVNLSPLEAAKVLGMDGLKLEECYVNIEQIVGIKPADDAGFVSRLVFTNSAAYQNLHMGVDEAYRWIGRATLKR